MRASETVSEASPSSTASQTGVPTQVVQQVQGTQQVGHGLRWGRGSPCLLTMAICFPVAQQQPLHCHCHRPPWPAALVQLPFLTSTEAAGPGKCAGQARPRVTPAAYQHSGATAGKAPAPASCGAESDRCPYCLPVSVLARVPGKGLIHRLPQLLWLWAVASRGKITCPGADGQAASGVTVLRTGEDQQQATCGSRPSIL